MCQVKELLRLRYEDAEKIPKCCSDILTAIRKSCDNVITDGTRPFRAVWRGYEKDHLVVMVDVHFLGIKPIGQVRHTPLSHHSRYCFSHAFVNSHSFCPTFETLEILGHQTKGVTRNISSSQVEWL
jgi:hypothetical protein